MNNCTLLDVRGLPCPQPVLRLKKLLKENPLQAVIVWCSDDITLVDFKAFCATTGYVLVDLIKEQDFYQFSVRKPS